MMMVDLDLIGRRFANLSKWVDESPANKARNPEALTWHRVAKVAEECGEVVEALIGATGGNPRKDVVGDDSKVIAELLDVAATALGAIEHLTGNAGHSYLKLAIHGQYLCERVGIEVPA